MANALPTRRRENGLARYLAEIASSRCWSRRRNICSPSVGASMKTLGGQKLVTSHLRLVARVAMGYRGYGLPIGEIVSEGNVGLMQAVKRFEPERGFRLATLQCGGSGPRFKNISYRSVAP